MLLLEKIHIWNYNVVNEISVVFVMISKKLEITRMIKEIQARLKAIKSDISLKEDKIDRIAPYPGQEAKVFELRKEIKKMERDEKQLAENLSILMDSSSLCDRIEMLKNEVQELNKELTAMKDFNKTTKIRYTIRLKSLEIQAIQGCVKKNIDEVKNVNNKR